MTRQWFDPEAVVEVKDGELVGKFADRLSFPWATVLRPSDILEMWPRPGENKEDRWLFVLNDDASATGPLLGAEATIWEAWHRKNRKHPTSLSGKTLIACENCEGTAAVLADYGPATGYWMCADDGCGWSELGFLTTCRDQLLALPWPSTVEIHDETHPSDDEVTIGVYREDQTGFTLSRPTWGEAELAAFTRFMAEDGDE